jgi:hypothetical protein
MLIKMQSTPKKVALGSDNQIYIRIILVNLALKLSKTWHPADIQIET